MTKFFLFISVFTVFTLIIDFYSYQGIKQLTTKYSDFYTSNHQYDKRYKLYEYILETEKLNDEIDYLEFGVAKGVSFRWWAEKIKNPAAKFYGFDTFTGLPESWGPFKKGDMSGGNEPPKMDDARVNFYQELLHLLKLTIPI